MIVTCPSCARKYSVQDDVIENEKLVRCVMCCTTWQLDKAHCAARKSKRLYIFLFTFLFSVGSYLTYENFNAILQTEYFTNLLLQLGVKIEKTKIPLEINNINTTFLNKNNKFFMKISGEIFNNANYVVDSPKVQVSVEYKINDELINTKWVYRPTNDKILPKEKILFETEPKEMTPTDSIKTNVTLV